NQRSLVVEGLVKNPEGKLNVGQAVTAVLSVAPESGLLEVPTAALNEVDGASFVFVQADPQKYEFTKRPITVVERFKDVVHLKANAALKEGDLVVTQAVLELTRALAELKDKESLEGSDNSGK